MRVKRTDASGPPGSTLPNGDKLLKYLPTESEEVMLAPVEPRVLPKKNNLATAYLSPSLFGNISKTLVLEVHGIGHWNLEPAASA